MKTFMILIGLATGIVILTAALVAGSVISVPYLAIVALLTPENFGATLGIILAILVGLFILLAVLKKIWDGK